MKRSCSLVWPLGLLVSLFFLWGAANSLNDVLIKQFTKAFALKDWQAGLVQSAFYVGYFFGALPAAMVARKYGYKAAVIVGLTLFSAGSLLFFPASRGGGTYAGFLACLYLIAFGLAFLESSANPWVTMLGDMYRQGAGTIALNLAQSFNPIGCILSVTLGSYFILHGREPPLTGDRSGYRVHEVSLVGLSYVYMGVGVAVVGAAFACTRFPEHSQDAKEAAAMSHEFSNLKLRQTGRRLLRNRLFVQGVIAQFFYCAAQVSVWSFVIRFVQQNMPDTHEQTAASFITISLGLFVVGRFLASALLLVVRDVVLLTLFGICAFAFCMVAAVVGGEVGVGAVCLTSLFMSMMYPTIFGLAVAAADEDAREIVASVLVMAIVGAALAPPAMGAVSDSFGITRAYFVPAICFLVVALHGFCSRGVTACGPSAAAAAASACDASAAKTTVVAV